MLVYTHGGAYALFSAASYEIIAHKLFPKAQIETTDSPRKYFKSDPGETVLFYSVEAGSAWTLIYPDFSVAVPAGLNIKAPGAFALPRGDLEFADYINTWPDGSRPGSVRCHLHLR